MLVDFKVSNYRSFKNEQDFSMETGKRLRKYQTTNTIQTKHERLLKSALLFGANANGKTNLINALVMLKWLIVNPTTDELQPLKTDTFGYNQASTRFEITFSDAQYQYNYILDYTVDEVVYEALSVDEQVVFKRNRQSFDQLPPQLAVVSDNIRKNQLLLYFAQQNNEQQSKLAYKWFVEDLIIVNTDRIRNDKFKLLQDATFKSKFLHFLQAADFNIHDVEVRERQESVSIPESVMKRLIATGAADEDFTFMNSTAYDVYSIHNAQQGTFPVYFDNESTGTKVFMFLALYILSNSEKTLLIDEFDRSYHLELAQALLSLINNKNQTNQFILTTHELSLMDADLRQDQIWFAEKNRFGESELFSIFDFDDPALKRSDFNYKKRYLEGVYGATQLINQKLLLEALEENE
ncbi:AAA family ATPase [Lactiplantibacillus mudanjiangensis]|uniref:ATPase AAA-type core domain-containing protein n=1 Tax=Lactiplantibacillus mudanjiangensis TaxID=1296538 RepID=A0A660DZQ6_9LACO|nr:ATP-binding protein [Lactiplantibacillus mudanjiangensis]VDG24690.1 hypothetical protein [Lactobacillus plantarum] [Lactiplantibacillus mudanjiangensis]VDG27715.1 hypothetical protein [Lactobacillus plantarum] [Lactiplantibacillus mudanjiangensis]